MKVIAVVGMLALLGQAAYAHHSTASVYDRSRIIEAEGEITEVVWANPHVRFAMRSVEPDGRERIWDIESNSVSIVSRFGLTTGLVAVGNRVKVAGNGGRVDDDVLWVTNMLLPTGEEILFGARIEPRWSDRTIGRDIRGAVAADRSDELGIFRVWTNVTTPPAFWGDRHPLTPAAAAARAAFDPIANDPTVNCAPKGMPYIMEQPYPLQFVDEGDEILMRMEEYDTVRRIAMTADADGGARGAARLGRSTGRWEDETLVIETADIDYPYFNATGIPLTRAARIEERFALNDGGSRLGYTMIVTDPATFTEPVTLTKAWEWRPGEEVRPYDCRQ
ncbi:MAG TPA: DUF6152 family protein [Gammaproteobacteria bacterium]|nr:DUF6152 family protein [Gammaproteobacteria bacterium]